MNIHQPSISKWKRVRYRVEAAMLRGLAWLVPLFSRRGVRCIGTRLGWLAYYLSPNLRRVARANLDLAFGQTKTAVEKATIARASLQNLGATLLGLLWSPRLTTRHQFEEVADIDPASLELIRTLQSRGKGVIFVTLHFGDWELLGLALGFYDIKLQVVAKAMRNSALEPILNQLRAHSGHCILPSRRTIPNLLKALKRGDCVALVIDQHVGIHTGGIWSNFFDLPVLTTSMVARLALHSGAAIVGGVAYPQPNGRPRLVYGPHIEWSATDQAEADVQVITQRCLQFCEATIRDHPEYWLWSYTRWKVRPHLEQGRYPFYSRPLLH